LLDYSAGAVGAEPPAGPSGRAPGQEFPSWSWRTFCFQPSDRSGKFASKSRFCQFSKPQLRATISQKLKVSSTTDGTSTLSTQVSSCNTCDVWCIVTSIVLKCHQERSVYPNHAGTLHACPAGWWCCFNVEVQYRAVCDGTGRNCCRRLKSIPAKIIRLHVSLFSLPRIRPCLLQ